MQPFWFKLILTYFLMTSKCTVKFMYLKSYNLSDKRHKDSLSFSLTSMELILSTPTVITKYLCLQLFCVKKVLSI